MAVEIERKFLPAQPDWRPQGKGTRFSQGYLSTHADRSVRVRVAGARALITVKGRTHGASRAEFEYDIPVDDARTMLAELCEQPIIDKTRYLIPHAGHTWEVDVFHGANQGLIIAEVELSREDEAVILPAWVGEEVTGDPRYYNARLVRHPFADWTD